MQCPIDQTSLTMTERNGVEIDYCPKCRGVWLDRGELDKIIERAAGAGPAVAGARAEPYRNRERDDDRDGDDERPGRRGRGSFLGDLFDF
jgi:Zn-finger nucleic acid-binding protein